MSNSRRIYTNGGPVQVGGGLYIERQADRELLSQCREGNYCFVLSSRQVGKSSLMLNIARRLKAEDQIESVIVDLQRMGAHLTAEQWYQGFLTRTAHNLAPEIDVADWWQSHGHLGHADRFTLFLQEELLAYTKKRIVIFVDEIDTTLSLDFSDDFFGALRAIYHAREESPEFRRLSFVLIGVATPNDLIADPKRTPFNIGQSIELKDFTFEEAQPLTAGFGLPEAEVGRVLQWVLKWTGGHPFLTQRLCRAVAEANRLSWTESQLDRLVAETFFGTQSEQDNHLRAVRDLMTKRAPNGYEEVLLKIYREVWRGRLVADEERSIAKSHLKLAGVVERNNEGSLRLRNPIYHQAFDEKWVKDHWPKQAWQRRVQRIALTALVAILVLNIPLGAYAWYQRGQAISRASELDDALRREQSARKEAERQTQLAKENAEQATTQKSLAEANARTAGLKAREAEAQRREAERQTQLANENAARADLQAGEAREQQKKAEASERISNRLAYVANLNLADKEFAASNYARGYELLNSYLPAPDAKEDPRDFFWYLLWKENHPEKQTLKGHTDVVDSVIWGSDGKTLISNSRYGTTKFWDVASGRELHTIQAYLSDMACTSDGKTLAGGSFDNTVRLFDAASAKELRILQGHAAIVRSVAWSSDGKTLASGSQDKTIKLWDAASGRELRTLQGHSDAIFSVAWSSDGKTLASGSPDKTIKLWDVSSGQLLHTFHGHADTVRSVAWSSDGKTIASASSDKTIKLWDVASGRELRTLQGHSSDVYSVAWSSDGKTLASGGFDRKIIVRRAATEDEVWAHTPDDLLPKRKLDLQPRAQR
jgi:WD40 repeat protein